MPSNLITQKEHNITRIKRGAAFLLGLCMALSLYACGGGQGPAGDMGRRLLRAGSGRRRPREGGFPLAAYRRFYAKKGGISFYGSAFDAFLCLKRGRAAS